MNPFSESSDFSEKDRLKQRFITRAKAISILRLSLLLISQLFYTHPVWVLALFSGIASSYVWASHPKWGRLLVFLTLILDLVWLMDAIAHSGFFDSPLIAILPCMTLLFALVFHRPFVLLPPLLLIPILTALHPDVPLQTIALFSLLNAGIIYLANKILGEEEATSYRILKLEQELKQQAILAERQRLSREIHDGVGSVLCSLIAQAEQDDCLEIKELAREALQETRYAISIMRDELDLYWEIKHCLEQFSKRHLIQSRLSIPKNLTNLSDAKSLSLLRIIQESLANIAKHAEATSVEIRASIEQNNLLLNIKDNGIGFDVNDIPKNHYGIRNIKERVQQMGGTLEIKSKPDWGTEIHIGASL